MQVWSKAADEKHTMQTQVLRGINKQLEVQKVAIDQNANYQSAMMKQRQLRNKRQQQEKRLQQQRLHQQQWRQLRTKYGENVIKWFETKVRFRIIGS